MYVPFCWFAQTCLADRHAVAAHLSATFGASVPLSADRDSSYPYKTASDLLITGTTAYFLLQSKKNSLKQYVIDFSRHMGNGLTFALARRRTQTLIDTFIRITWQSAAPAAVWFVSHLRETLQ